MQGVDTILGERIDQPDILPLDQMRSIELDFTVSESILHRYFFDAFARVQNRNELFEST